MEALQAQHERIHALTNARGIATGHAFKLKSHPRADQNKKYLIVATQLELVSNEHEAAASSGLHLATKNTRQSSIAGMEISPVT